jgi:hypothetical protein
MLLFFNKYRHRNSITNDNRDKNAQAPSLFHCGQQPLPWPHENHFINIYILMTGPIKTTHLQTASEIYDIETHSVI